MAALVVLLSLRASAAQRLIDVAALGALLAVVLALARGAADTAALADDRGTGAVLLLLPALIAFVAAVVWYNLTPPYDRFIAAAATPLVKIDPRFRGAHLAAEERVIKVTGSVPAANIPADQLTYNVILLAALFGGVSLNCCFFPSL